MTFAQFSRKLGLPPSTLYRLEKTKVVQRSVRKKGAAAYNRFLWTKYYSNFYWKRTRGLIFLLTLPLVISATFYLSPILQSLLDPYFLSPSSSNQILESLR